MRSVISERLFDLNEAYKLRWKRRRLLWRAYKARRALRAVSDKTGLITPQDILCFSTMRNEMLRLPFFLAHHRALGVGHFLIVVNDATDGTVAYLQSQPDVSVWTTGQSYKSARFGMDWLGWLLLRHGHGHWTLTLDADETLVYPQSETVRLPQLTHWLEARGAEVFSAVMLDLYPQGPVSETTYAPGDSPLTRTPWFDGTGYTWEWLRRYRVVSIRGGPRKRAFFSDTPDLAPHLHKTPLVKWHWRYAYASSTHLLLPRRLNAGFDARQNLPTGALMHSKFLQDAVGNARNEKLRSEHFTHSSRYDMYYDAVMADPDFWCRETSVRYKGSDQLERLGLISRGGWVPD